MVLKNKNFAYSAEYDMTIVAKKLCFATEIYIYIYGYFVYYAVYSERVVFLKGPFEVRPNSYIVKSTILTFRRVKQNFSNLLSSKLIKKYKKKILPNITSRAHPYNPALTLSLNRD